MTVNPTPTSHPAPTEAIASAAAGPLLNDAQIRWVRGAVMVMTALLVAGIALLIGRVIYLARAGGTQAASASAAQPAAMDRIGGNGQPALMPEVRLSLPAGAEIRGIAAMGSRLAVSHTVPGGSDGITVVDLGTGQVVSRVTIERAK